MKLFYAERLLNTYHERYGEKQPCNNQGYRECYLMMEAWNKRTPDKHDIPWIQYNKFRHVGDGWKLPEQYGKALGWHSYDDEIIITSKSWFEIYTSHITKQWWLEALDQLEDITGLDHDTTGPILIAILKYQVSTTFRPKDSKLISKLEAKLAKLGHDVSLKDGTQADDLEGKDYVCDADWSTDTDVVVQVKSNFNKWYEYALTAGTRQAVQREHYHELATQYKLYIYDYSTDSLIRWH